MFGLFKKKNKEVLDEIVSPCKGEVVHLSNVPDPVFAELMMGDGIAINPVEGRLYSPVNGEVVQIFETKHAIVVRSEDNTDILMHVGLETVSLEGVPFDVKVVKGQKVSKGQLLMDIDLEYIESKGLNKIIPIIIMNEPGKVQKTIVSRSDERPIMMNDNLMNVK